MLDIINYGDSFNSVNSPYLESLLEYELSSSMSIRYEFVSDIYNFVLLVI